jgi:hypothetical protein
MNTMGSLGYVYGVRETVRMVRGNRRGVNVLCCHISKRRQIAMFGGNVPPARKMAWDDSSAGVWAATIARLIDGW